MNEKAATLQYYSARLGQPSNSSFLFRWIRAKWR